MQFKLHHFTEIESTNTKAIQLAAEEAPCGTAVYADVQTAGRGRRGRVWRSLNGNLMFSVVLRRQSLLDNLYVLPYLIGLAIHDVIAECLPDEAVTLKWPNDVLVNRRKISGVLIEKDGHTEAIIVGIGLNVVIAPEVPDYPSCALIDFISQPPSRGQVLRDVLNSIAKFIKIFETRGESEIFELWNQYSYKLGQEITVKLHGKSATGIFEGVNNQGELVLATPEGLRYFRSIDEFI